MFKGSFKTRLYSLLVAAAVIAPWTAPRSAHAQGTPATESVTVAPRTDAEAKDEANEDDREDKSEQMHFVERMVDHRGHSPIVPVAFFVFILGIILGSRYLREKTAQRKIELLKAMVEKGQTVPESVMQQFVRHDYRYGRGRHSAARGYRGTLIGIGLLAYAFLTPGHHGTVIIVAIVFLGVGLGSILARRDLPPDSSNKSTLE